MLQGFLIFVAYFLAGRLSVKIHALSGVSPLIWLPSGIALSALLVFERSERRERRLWPAILLASFTLNLSLRSSVPLALFFAISSTVEAWLGAYLLKRLCPPGPTFTKVREVLIFLILVMGLSAFLGSSIKVFGLYLSGTGSAGDLLATWRSWWVGEAAAQLLITTTIISWIRDNRTPLTTGPSRSWEGLALLIAVTATALFVYTPLADYNHSLIIRPYFLFMLMIWAALRFGGRGATTTLLIVMTTVVYGEIKGYIAPSGLPVGDRMVIQQFFAIALGMTGLVISAALRERDEAIEAQREFLHVASHELKTPITSMRLQLQLTRKKLLSRLSNSEPELEELSFLNKAGNQVERLVYIIEQLLDTSAIGRQSLTLHCEWTDLSTLVKNLLASLEGDLAAAGCAAALELQPGIVCRWDSSRFEQVLANLVSNAIKYAPGKKPIRITAKESSEMVEIVVTDHGPGIEASKQAHVFDRYFRANSSSAVAGLGLGLFITKQIVEAHRGKIWVESRVGEGSSFFVRMPVDAEVQDAQSVLEA